MARINRVKKAVKDQGTCGRCGKELPAGSAYKWVMPRAGKFARGYKRVRCTDCPDWRPSELTSSDKLSTIYAAQEGFQDALSAGFGSAEDLAQALRDAAEQIREAAEGYRESAQAIEDGFGHSTYVSEELNGKADEVESWADEIDSSADEADTDNVVCLDCGNAEDDGCHHGFDLDEDRKDEDEPVCKDCGESEDEHHDFEADIEALVDEVSGILYEMPI